VQNTLEIRYFKILSESSAAAGIRRIEALTGDTAIAYLEDRNSKLRNLESLLKNPKDSEKALEELLLQQKETEKVLEDIQHRQLMSLRDDLIQQSKSGGAELKALVQVANADALKTLSFELRKMTQGKTIILGALLQDKPMLSVILSEDVQPDETLNASKIIRELAKAIHGGGGGQDFYATAGGKKAEGLKEIFG
jgi:alanyl-tRNA synthetase